MAKFFRKLFLVVHFPTKKFKKLVEKTTRKKVESNWKKLVFWKIAFFKSLLTFITFVNYERAYLVQKFFTSFFHISRLAKRKKETKKKKFVETVAVCRMLLDYNLFCKITNQRSSCSDIPSRKTSLW